MYPIFSSSVPSPETRRDEALSRMPQQELERLPGNLPWMAHERAGVEVNGVCPWLQVKLFHLQRHDARDALLHLDLALDLEDGVLAHARRTLGVDPREDHDLGEAPRVVELEHGHHIAFARCVGPHRGR